MTPLDLSVDAAADSARIRVRGELDVESSPALRDLIVRLVSEGRTNIVLDCHGLAFVDSTGLGVFVGARARALAANGTVVLDNVQPALERLLAVTGMAGLFGEKQVTAA
jgi:anti-sigma B factor antagonist